MRALALARRLLLPLPILVGEVALLGPTGPVITRIVRGALGVVVRSLHSAPEEAPESAPEEEVQLGLTAGIFKLLEEIQAGTTPAEVAQRLRGVPRGLVREVKGVVLRRKWLIIYMVIHHLNGRRKSARRALRTAAIHLMRNPSTKMLGRVLALYPHSGLGSGLHSNVDINSFVVQNFATVDRVNFLNYILEVVFPHVDAAVAKLVEETLRAPLDAARPPGISSLGFETFTLGSKPPVIQSIRHIPSPNAYKEGITLQVNVSWGAEPHIVFAARGPAIYGGLSPLLVQVEDLHFSGTLHVTLKPILPMAPVVGGVGIMFTDEPYINYGIKVKTTPGIAPMSINLVPGLGPVLLHLLDGVLKKTMTFPNNIRIPIVVPGMDMPFSKEEVDEMLKIKPIGKLIVTIKRCQGLKNKRTVMDKLAVFKGEPDPYCRVGIVPPKKRLDDITEPGKVKRTVTIQNCRTPVWDARFEFDVEDLELQDFVVEVMDRDVTCDEMLGFARLDLSGLRSAPGSIGQEHCFPLRTSKDRASMKQSEGGKAKGSGEILLHVEWRPLHRPASMYDAMKEDDGSRSAKNPLQEKTLLQAASRKNHPYKAKPRWSTGSKLVHATSRTIKGLMLTGSRRVLDVDAISGGGHNLDRVGIARSFNPFAIPAGYTTFQERVEEALIYGSAGGLRLFRGRRKHLPSIHRSKVVGIKDSVSKVVGMKDSVSPLKGLAPSRGSIASKTSTDLSDILDKIGTMSEKKAAEVDDEGMPRGTGNSWRPPPGVGPLLYVGLKPASATSIPRRRLKKMIAAASTDNSKTGLPAWVMSPSVERTLWLDMLLSKLWRVIREVVRWEVHDANKIIREELKGKLGNWIDVIVGAKAGLLPFVVVDGIEVHKGDSTGVVLDVHLKVAGDMEVAAQVNVRPLPFWSAGVRVSEVNAMTTLRIQLQPILPMFPIVGAVTISTIGTPFLDLALHVKLSPLLPAINLTASPIFSLGKKFLLDKVLMPQIGFPAAFTVPLVDLSNRTVRSLGVDLLRQDTGVLSVRVVAAKGLRTPGDPRAAPLSDGSFIRLCTGQKLSNLPYEERFQKTSFGTADPTGKGLQNFRGEFHFLVHNLNQTTTPVHLTIGAFHPMNLGGAIIRGMGATTLRASEKVGRIIRDLEIKRKPGGEQDELQKKKRKGEAERVLMRVPALVRRSLQLMIEREGINGSVPWSNEVRAWAASLDWYLTRRRDVQRGQATGFQQVESSHGERPISDWLESVDAAPLNQPRALPTRPPVPMTAPGDAGTANGALTVGASAFASVGMQATRVAALKGRLQSIRKREAEWARNQEMLRERGLCSRIEEMVEEEVGSSVGCSDCLGLAIIRVQGLAAHETRSVWIPLEGAEGGGKDQEDSSDEEDVAAGRPPGPAICLELTWRPHKNSMKHSVQRTTDEDPISVPREFEHWMGERGVANMGIDGEHKEAKTYGTLVCELVKASELSWTTLAGGCGGARIRPQVEVQVGRLGHRSAKGFGQNHTWNQRFEFVHFAPEDAEMAMEVRVYDCGPLGTRARMGAVTVPLHDVMATGTVTSTVYLSAGRGGVVLRLTWREEYRGEEGRDPSLELAPQEAAAGIMRREEERASGGRTPRGRTPPKAVRFDEPTNPPQTPRARAGGASGGAYPNTPSFLIEGDVELYGEKVP
mmetsp:Transcript_58141/g.185018  ORF Transcript_58141/g.185018 Transcript_58141/m.185018 type:complete len:1663 (-) Transcript_58141:163-5151(-)